MKKIPKKILLVEDDQESAQLLKARLKSAGYEIGWAASGARGLKIARLSKPDLIILDVMLPDMDGYKICRLLKFDQKYQHIPIILLTGRQQKKDINLGRSVGADVYIVKPFDPEKLLNTVKNLMQKAPPPYVVIKPSIEQAWKNGLKISKTD